MKNESVRWTDAKSDPSKRFYTPRGSKGAICQHLVFELQPKISFRLCNEPIDVSTSITYMNINQVHKPIETSLSRKVIMPYFHGLRCLHHSSRRHSLMVVFVLAVMGISNVVECFHVPSTKTSNQQQLRPNIHPNHLLRQSFSKVSRGENSNMMMLSPNHVHDLFVTASMYHGLDLSNQIFSGVQGITEMNTVVATSENNVAMTQWIADAANAAASAKDDGGWWKAYINIFKSILTFVHSSVDGPLRSVGIEQTWGVSIFLFTAST